jgi:hypothetical protein
MRTLLKSSVPQEPQETAWHSRLDPVNDALWIAGYRAYVRCNVLYVRKPDGTKYIVSPYQQTCSCPASVRCKHLRGLTSLVFLSMGALSASGKWAAYEALCEYWHKYCVKAVAR